MFIDHNHDHDRKISLQFRDVLDCVKWQLAGNVANGEAAWAPR